MSDKPLWSDDRIIERISALALVPNGCEVYEANALVISEMRDEYEQRITELTAENERLRAAAEWEPVPDGKYDVGKGYVYDVSESGQRIRRRVDEFPAGTLWLPYKQGWCLMRRRQPQEAKQVE